MTYDAYVLDDLVSRSQTLALATRNYSTQSIDWAKWPHVEYPDIYNFLVESPIVYIGESLKVYKSLDAYNYYMNGWVSSIRVFEGPVRLIRT